MNIEIDQETLDELEHAFRFNDAVLRHLTTQMNAAVTEPSPMMKQEKSRSLPTGDAAQRAAVSPCRGSGRAAAAAAAECSENRGPAEPATVIEREALRHTPAGIPDPGVSR